MAIVLVLIIATIIIIYKNKDTFVVKALLLPFKLGFWVVKMLLIGFNNLPMLFQADNTFSFGKSKYMGFNQLLLFNRWNKGLTLDGKRFISRKISYQHSILIAPTGTGKTVRYIFPNILLKPDLKCSIVVTDPSSEILKVSAVYLAQHGYTIKVIDLEDTKEYYNPIHYTDGSLTGASELIESIFAITLPNAQDPYWNEASASITSLLLFAMCKVNFEKATLSNLLDYVNKLMSPQKVEVDELVSLAFSDVHSEKYFNSYKAFITINEKTRMSILSHARTGLAKFQGGQISELTSRDTLELHKLRKTKTIIYLVVPEHKQEYYKFITTIFHEQLFAVLMDFDFEDKEQLPVNVLLEELGNQAAIRSLLTVLTAGRKRLISTSLILQSKEQLNAIYGNEQAKIIFDNCVTKIVYGGISIEQAQVLSQTIGNTTVLDKEGKWTLKNLFVKRKNSERQKQLLSPNEIRSLGNAKALVLISNKPPMILKTLPYFKNKKLMRRLKKANQKNGERLKFLTKVVQRILSYFNMKKLESK